MHRVLEMRGEFGKNKIGATVAFVFVTIIFSTVAIYVSQIGSMSDDVIVIKQQLAILVKQLEKQENGAATQEKGRREILDRLCKVEFILSSIK